MPAGVVSIKSLNRGNVTSLLNSYSHSLSIMDMPEAGRQVIYGLVIIVMPLV